MSIRRLPRAVCTLLVFLCVGVTSSLAQNQAFTYQGRIANGGLPATGPVNLVVKLFAIDTGGVAIGTQSINGVPLLDGIFTVTLNAAGEFTANPFATGAARWVEITVNGTVLAPRQKLSVAPMAAFSAAPWVLNGTTLSYTAGKVAVGNTTADRPLTLNEASVPAGATRASQLMSLQTDAATQWHLNLVSPDGSASTNYGLNFAESGVSDFRLFLARGGNVGIGTASPTGRLEIASLNDALVIRPPTMVGGNVASILFRDPDGGSPPTRLSFKDTGFPNLSVTSATAAPARLGVNTTDPTQVLDVRGEIAFGSTGQFSPVASGSGAIRTVYAVVNSADGSLFSGSGLTVVKTAVGRFTVTFNPAFTNYPAVVVTPFTSGGLRAANVNNMVPSSVRVEINNAAGAGVDEFFTIIAVGPR